MITKVEFKKFNFTEKPSLKNGYKVRYRGKELSDKQVIILEHLAIGATNKEISENMQISRRTVETHIVRIRKLLSGELGYNLGERELVLFAKDMLEGFKVFLSLEAELESTKKKAEMIDDWDDEETIEEEEEDPLELPEGYKSFNGIPILKEKPRKYINKIFDISDFKVESKTVIYKDGTYRLT